jgi:DNA-binding transcriptional MerR regulator
MDSDEAGLTIEELARRSELPVRTIRYYIAEGLLPGPGGRGKAATYGEDHRLRLRLIRRLTEQHLPLAEIRERLAGLGPDDLRALLEAEEERTATLAQAAREPSPKEFIAALLQRAGAAEPARRLKEAAPVRLASPAPMPAPPAAERRQATPPTPDDRDDPAQAWERWVLEPGLELHVRRDVARRRAPLIGRLLAAARQILRSESR